MKAPAPPELLRAGFLDMQVCVPATFTDEQVLAFAESANPCGTSNGWHIRREGDALLRGAPERMICVQFPDRVHIILDA